MSKPKHVMLDIETLSTGDRPHPLQIAWVAFDPESYLESMSSRRSFYVSDDLTNRDFSVDIRTVLWWLAQSDAARQRIISGIAGRLDAPSFPLKKILQAFAEDISQNDVLYVRGVDNIWMASYYQAFDLPIPFNFRKVVEIRSLIDALLPGGEKPVDVGTSHDALDDCLFQIDHLGMAMRRLRGLQASA